MLIVNKAQIAVPLKEIDWLIEACQVPREGFSYSLVILRWPALTQGVRIRQAASLAISLACLVIMGS